MEQENYKYERVSNLLKKKKTLFVKSVGNQRNYPALIRKKDDVFVVGIKEEVKCPICGNISEVSTTFPYSFDDLIELWKIAFEIIVLPQEMEKTLQKIDELKKWMKDKLNNLSNWM